MTENTDPKQIVCTGEEGSDAWNSAFGTWSADDFGMDSDETVGDGERLYVRRDLYDAAVNALEPFSKMAGELFARNYDAPDTVLMFRSPEGEEIRLEFGDFLVVRDALQQPLQ